MKEKVVEQERRLRKRWTKEGTFQKSVANREGHKTFVFYEGPPTANGLPHAGHALGRTVKDFIARYKTMRGYQVLRKAGWDTHGLPVELEVEKQLNIRGKDEIEAYGVENFIRKCKESVFSYEREWRQFTEALGYWVDMDDPYITLTNDYIESVWHILAAIHKKGLLYKGHRVVPYCPHCETSLSSHEVAQGYKQVMDLSATAKFPIKGRENHYLLGWTTTPWTLPGNVAIAVHPEQEYVQARKGNDVYIVAAARANTVLGNDFDVQKRILGEELVGTAYEAPFAEAEIEKGHQVIAASFVTEESGTGLVHIAPGYGEEDYNAVLENGLDFIHVVDEKGRYKQEFGPLAGRFVKDADVDIIKMLAAKGRLYAKEKYEHSYPHCWRCDSPLLYYAMEGWFIRTTAVKEQMQANNQGVEWYPGHIKDGRFGHFLENMVDWNIGRNRFWGTPLNVWVCQTCGREKAPGSLQELRQWAITELGEGFELHKPYVDDVQFACPCGGQMERTKEVIDVWFDSGAMPFAQYHYPFENQDCYHKQFPADVVIEGVDQTRGWFYSLLAVSTLYKGVAPYKRVLSLGHILDEHGQKMSKSKGNVLHPLELIEEYGADALRWALLADSAPWHNKRFSKQTVSQAKSKVIDTLRHAHAFFNLYAEIDGFDPDKHWCKADSLLDCWIVSRLHSLIKEVTCSLETYDLTKGARLTATFLDEMSNWYIRRTRQRFWASGMNEDKKAAYSTLYHVLTKTAQLIAPFAPFVADEVYSELKGDSVHLSDYPQADDSLIDQEMEDEMAWVLQIVERARFARNKAALKTKQPLQTLVVMETSVSVSPKLEKYGPIIQEETNVKEVVFHKQTSGLMSIHLNLNFAVAGPKFGKNIAFVKQQLDRLTDAEKARFLEKGECRLQDGTLLEHGDVHIERRAQEGYVLAEGNDFTVLLDTRMTTELLEEGFVRELVRAVQAYRKELGFSVNQRIDLYLDVQPPEQAILEKFKGLLDKGIVLRQVYFESKEGMKPLDVEGRPIGLYIGS